MGILTSIVMGLIVGVVAKLIMPGKDPGGFINYRFAGYRRRFPRWLCRQPGWSRFGFRI